MTEYKKENNFKCCLGKLQLSNVIDAIARVKKIMQKIKKTGIPYISIKDMNIIRKIHLLKYGVLLKKYLNIVI